MSQQKPKLLAGDNPQIPKADGDTPVQAFIEASPGWKGEVSRALDDLVNQIVPDVKKAVRWSSPFYGVEGKGWFLSFHHFKNYVKLTFLRGDDLDPKPEKTSKHAHVRYHHIEEGDDLGDGPLRDWIKQASENQGEDMF